jgi:tartrate dehydratase alpha subunit/fumarate hydratase class I-like protein
MRVRQFSNSLSVALSQDHFEQIKQITDAEKISMAEWVRNAINVELQKYQHEEDVMETI